MIEAFSFFSQLGLQINILPISKTYLKLNIKLYSINSSLLTL